MSMEVAEEMTPKDVIRDVGSDPSSSTPLVFQSGRKDFLGNLYPVRSDASEEVFFRNRSVKEYILTAPTDGILELKLEFRHLMLAPGDFGNPMAEEIATDPACEREIKVYIRVRDMIGEKQSYPFAFFHQNERHPWRFTPLLGKVELHARNIAAGELHLLLSVCNSSEKSGLANAEAREHTMLSTAVSLTLNKGRFYTT